MRKVNPINELINRAILVMLLVACQPSASAVQTAVAKTSIFQTQTAPPPTLQPTVTLTPLPSPTPLPELKTLVVTHDQIEEIVPGLYRAGFILIDPEFSELAPNSYEGMYRSKVEGGGNWLKFHLIKMNGSTSARQMNVSIKAAIQNCPSVKMPDLLLPDNAWMCEQDGILIAGFSQGPIAVVIDVLLSGIDAETMSSFLGLLIQYQSSNIIDAGY